MKHLSHLCQSRIAIIEPNVLACMGLQRLLAELFPMVETVVCESFCELQQHAGTVFVHYFISSRIYFEHTSYFRSCSGRCIVLVNGDMSIHGVVTINVCQGQAALISDLVRLQRSGHHGNSHTSVPVMAGLSFSSDVSDMPARGKPEVVLSPREMEVASLLCHGYINKEVADKLDIGLTTVITHRKNIMEKLKAKSLADVIVYCVMNGIYSV
ncbi:MAG: LuxR C-terminal-related transcriptional regulator [Bacteroides sp.]|nr:LuxR C-terminal-related transcriptional regulator [Bacteroides sp.]MCM1447328.1 LuxR C-terminal-related transcriptional regulator [Bacteroides sp.]